MKALVLVTVCLLASCDSDPDGASDADANTGAPGATITLGGAHTAVMPALAVASKRDTESFSTVGVSITSPQGQVTSASISVRLSGTPAAGTYPATVFEIGALEVSTSDARAWSAFSTPAIGTIGVLSLSSVDVLSSGAGLTLYTVHGSLASSTLTSTMQGVGALTMTSSF